MTLIGGAGTTVTFLVLVLLHAAQDHTLVKEKGTKIETRKGKRKTEATTGERRLVHTHPGDDPDLGLDIVRLAFSILTVTSPQRVTGVDRRVDASDPQTGLTMTGRGSSKLIGMYPGEAGIGTRTPRTPRTGTWKEPETAELQTIAAGEGVSVDEGVGVGRQTCLLFE